MIDPFCRNLAKQIYTSLKMLNTIRIGLGITHPKSLMLKLSTIDITKLLPNDLCQLTKCICCFHGFWILHYKHSVPTGLIYEDIHLCYKHLVPTKSRNQGINGMNAI